MSNPIGTYSVTGLENVTESNQYTDIDDLLIRLPDNEDNEIDAKDIRDAVYTLWERTGSGSTSSSVFFQNETPTPVTVGGIPAGSTFTEPTDMQEMWNKLLYPYVAPSASLGPNYLREYGDPDGLSINSLTLNWSVTKNSDSITLIQFSSSSGTSISTTSVTPTGDSQSGTVTITGTHSDTPGSSQTNNFSISVTDGNQTVTNNAAVIWRNKIYWGSIDLGGVNLSTNPQLVTQVALICDDSAILNLDGAGVGSGDQISSSKNKVYNGINGNGEHLIFAWPSSVVGATSPTFTINGLPNTAFTRVRTSSPFTNQHGFTTNYEVWVSDTLQNSPISLFSIS